MVIVFNQHPDGTFDIEYFQRTPSREAGLAFVAIFAAATAVHVGYMFSFREWSFIPTILGGICKFAVLVAFSTSPLADISSKCEQTSQNLVLQVKPLATTAASRPIRN